MALFTLALLVSGADLPKTKVCWNGNSVPVADECPTPPPPPTKTCNDGSVILASQSCTAKPKPVAPRTESTRFDCLPLLSPDGPLPAGFARRATIEKTADRIRITAYSDRSNEDFLVADAGEKTLALSSFTARAASGRTISYQYGYFLVRSSDERNGLLVSLTKPQAGGMPPGLRLVYTCAQ